MTQEDADDTSRGFSMSSRDRCAPTPGKPYRRPVIHVYGNIRAITQAVGSNGLMDGSAVAGMMMTML